MGEITTDEKDTTNLLTQTQSQANVNKVIKNSVIGKKLPMKVKNLKTDDLLKLTALVKFSFFVATVLLCELITTYDGENMILKGFFKISSWIAYLMFIDLGNYVIYFLELIDLFNICYLATIIKTGITQLFFIAGFFILHGTIIKGFMIVYCCMSLYFDTIFLLYLDVHFKDIKTSSKREINHEEDV